ncbi:MAG: sensor histidine kinase, partial [Bdellovibrionota bacterium]
GVPEVLAKRIRLNNMLSLLTTVVISPYFFLLRHYGETFYAWMILPTVTAFMAVVALNHAGRHRLARILMVTVSNAAVALYALAFARTTGLYLFFLPVCSLPLLLFGLKDRLTLAYGIVLPAVLLQVFSVWHGSSLFPQIALSETATPVIRGATLLVVSIFLVFQIASLSRAYERSEESLRKTLAEVQAAQSKLVQSSKMSSLGEMASGIAHEINNPLSIISVRVDQLANAAESGTIANAEIVESSRKIQATVQRIANIIRGLRTFSRHAEGDPFLTSDLRGITEDVLEVCRERFRSRRILMHVYLSPELKVECRPAQIAQVLLNLLGNAYDAVENLPERWIRVAAGEAEEHIEIEIIDSGKGIAPAVSARLMEPFFTTKEVGRGTGLGLSISKGIVEQHQGTLSYDAASPNTRFVIRLPKKITQRKAA